MLVSREQNADQNREIKLGNRSLENVSQFKDLSNITILVVLATIRSKTFCLLVFRRKTTKKWNMQHFNFACGSAWV
jgi:hypothetical protein